MGIINFSERLVYHHVQHVQPLGPGECWAEHREASGCGEGSFDEDAMPGL